MRKLIYLVVLLQLFIFSSSWCYALCNNTPIQTISERGKVISLINGSVWRTNSDNTAVGWDTSNYVIMCGDGQMINKDANETISVFRVK